MAQAAVDEDLDWAVSVDSTIVRAHQHTSGKGSVPADHAIVRFRGGPTTKIHLAAHGADAGL